MELNGSLTATELKKPHPSRLVGGAQMQKGWSHTHVWWIKIQEGHLRSDIPGSSARKVSPHNCYCKNQWGLSQGKKLLEPQAVPLKEPTHRLTYSDSHGAPPPRWQLEGHPVAYWERLKCLALG